MHRLELTYAAMQLLLAAHVSSPTLHQIPWPAAAAKRPNFLIHLVDQGADGIFSFLISDVPHHRLISQVWVPRKINVMGIQPAQPTTQKLQR
jgi:hypothetical protein